MPMRDASVSNLNCHEGSGHVRTGALVIRVIICSCASCCSFPQVNGTSFLVRQNNDAVMMEKFLQNMQWYPVYPRNPQTYLRLWRVLGYSLSPATFAGSTVTPSFDMHTPRKSICG